MIRIAKEAKMLVRTVLFPVRLTYGVGKLSARTGYRAGRSSVVGTYRAGHLLGYRRMLAVGVGVGIGLLVAPRSGQELRDELRRRWEERGGPPSDDVLADRVRYELSHSPRTWHLPQPEVAVVGGRAVLSGAVPHPTGKEDLERTAAQVGGITGVESKLEVSVSGADVAALDEGGA